MPYTPVPQPLAHALKQYCHINAISAGWPQQLLSELNYPGEPTRATMFRQQLAGAILNETITPKQYEDLTGEDFDTQADLQVRLRELWSQLYGDTPITQIAKP